MTRFKRYLSPSVTISLIFGLLLTLPAAAQDSPAVASEPEKQVIQKLSQDGIKARIADLEAVEGPDKETQAVLELYRKALAQLVSAQADDELSAQYRQAVDGSAQQQAKLEEQLRQQRKAFEKNRTIALDLSLDELKQQLDKTIASNSLDQSRLSDLESELRKERLRPDQTSAELQEAKHKLTEAEGKKPATKGLEEAVSVAQRAADLANKRVLDSRIKRLEMERLSHTLRMSLLKMRIELVSTQLKRSRLWERLLQDELNRSLAQEAEKARKEAERARRLALDKHPVVQKQAEYNSQLSLKLGNLTGGIEKVIAQKEEIASKLIQIKQDRKRSQQQVNIVGLDKSLGELLLTQNRTLPNVRKLEIKVDEYRQQMSQVRIQAFKLEDELQQLSEDKGIARFIESLQPVGLKPVELISYNKAMQRLIKHRLELLKKISAEYDRYESGLSDLSLEQHQLSSEVAGYREFLNRNLVWIPSAAQLGLADLGKIKEALGWLFSGENWSAVAVKLMDAVQQFYGRVGIVVLIIIVLTLLRGRMLAQMEDVVPKIGKVNFDRFRFSVVTLIYTFLLALPPALAVGSVGWLLYKDESANFVWAVGMAAMAASALYFILRFGRYLIMPNGLARNHLRWDPYAIDVYAKTLPWLTPLFLIFGFVAGITEWELEEGYWNSLGRVASIVTTLIMLWFAHISLNPKYGALSRSSHIIVQGLRLRVLWYPLVFLLALGLLLLTVQGYHYTAIVFKRLIFTSFAIGVTILLLQSFARRWLLVAQRRLALKRARARREAALEAKAAKEAADAAGEGLPEAEELEAINLATISEQTQRLLRMLGVVSFFVAMFLLWSTLTPALWGLDEIILWKHQAVGASGVAMVAVSVWDLLLSFAVVMLMLFAVKNLPGLLEIAVLQPLSLEPGNRYAVTMISRYTIFAVGFFVALNMLGINWSDVQWLVAAMGVGLGFGLKEIFANFFSGLIILFERPIRIGDTVTIDNLSGTVTKIRIRATTVTDWDNKEQVIPNQNFLINPLINWTLSDPITRVVFNVGIAYGSDTEKALQVITDVVHAHPEVLEEPRPTVFFIGFGNSSLDFEVRAFVPERLRRMPLRHDLHMALNKAWAEAGIEIPFPQRDLHLRSIAPGLDLKGDG
ncbi:MAG: mechanosensitive ion channel [Gammaproteobacteria bacterium]|nr:mechanosensitive ion channel [Gammaproteobacteria bacterium]